MKLNQILETYNKEEKPEGLHEVECCKFCKYYKADLSRCVKYNDFLVKPELICDDYESKDLV